MDLLDGKRVEVPARDEEPTAKRLRSSDPDLQVVVKFTGDDGKVVEKEYAMYAGVLAGMSKFVDAMLAAPMKENNDGKVVLEDVSPEVFEAALKFEQDTTAARNMTAEDAVKVLEFYDKFEFTGGLHLCNVVLNEYFQQQLDLGFKKPPDNLNLLIEAIMLAEQCNLPEALKNGVLYMHKKMCSGQTEYPFGGTMFTKEHIKKLQPLFVKGVIPYGDNEIV